MRRRFDVRASMPSRCGDDDMRYEKVSTQPEGAEAPGARAPPPRCSGSCARRSCRSFSFILLYFVLSIGLTFYQRWLVRVCLSSSVLEIGFDFWWRKFEGCVVGWMQYVRYGRLDLSRLNWGAVFCVFCMGCWSVLVNRLS